MGECWPKRGEEDVFFKILYANVSTTSVVNFLCVTFHASLKCHDEHQARGRLTFQTIENLTEKNLIRVPGGLFALERSMGKQVDDIRPTH